MAAALGAFARMTTALPAIEGQPAAVPSNLTDAATP
jgi:hypothetical protein